MENKSFVGILYGWIVILAAIFISSIILTFILKMTTISDASLTWISLAVGLCSLFAGGLVAGVKGKQKGWVIGGAVGLGFTLLTFIAQYLGYHEGFSFNQLLHHAGYIMAASVGGVIGVNASAPKQA
ncbi:MAG TPA: TIGR04086 family membrane protein [Virgibacillus sp.]|nr:TIGR04086 family membrane protein [Virgibacillus sp.]